MRKNYVLDTNVLLHDPNAIFAFEEHTVIIPIYVIEEIDNFKRDLSELGRSAREIGRMLDDLRYRFSSDLNLFVAERAASLPTRMPAAPERCDLAFLPVPLRVCDYESRDRCVDEDRVLR